MASGGDRAMRRRIGFDDAEQTDDEVAGDRDHEVGHHATSPITNAEPLRSPGKRTLAAMCLIVREQ